MEVEERSKQLKERKGCAICTSWLHQSDKCWSRFRMGSCQVMEKGKKYGEKHDSSLHVLMSRYCQVNTAKLSCCHEPKSMSSSPVLLRIQDIRVGCGEKRADTLILFDSRTTATLITHDFAEKLGLKGVSVTYYLKVVRQGYTMKQTKSYQVSLMDIRGKRWNLDVLGIDAITSVDVELYLSAVICSFTGAPEGAFHCPAGSVNLLLGSNYEALQPFDGVLVGGLRMLELHFGVGKVLSGNDKCVKSV